MITSDPRELEQRKLKGDIQDTRSIDDLAQIYDPPATQQAVTTETTKNKTLIERAVGKRKEDMETIQQERLTYQEELKKRLEEQERELNPQKYESQKTFNEIIDENTIPGKVIQERADIQKGKSHITPQGVIGDENEEQPKQY